MIERYTRPKMAYIWSEQNKYDAWLKVELLACEAWSKLGIIPEKDVKVLKNNAVFDVQRILEIEQQTRHDVIAFTRALSENLGNEKKWVHYGLTSSDVVDTANGYLLKQANSLLLKEIDNLISILKQKALKYKNTIMMGRTHGVHAEPTTFGLKMALWYEEMKRNKQRFIDACKSVEVGKISGAVGTYANVDPFVEEYVCAQLGLSAAPISTQIVQRDRHAAYISVLALIASSLDKFATEIRSMQRSEIREVEESFGAGQKGSSAMPHKRNPISCENISGLSRIMRGYMVSAYENISLWNERDISHSSVERIILPDATMLLDYMLSRFAIIIDNLIVYPDNMLNNIKRTFDLPFSGRVLTALIDKGLSRENAYDLVQSIAMEAWNTQTSFKQLVHANNTIGQHLNIKEIDQCFDLNWYLKHIDTIYNRLQLM